MIGKPLVTVSLFLPYQVAGMTRTPEKVHRLRRWALSRSSALVPDFAAATRRMYREGTRHTWSPLRREPARSGSSLKVLPGGSGESGEAVDEHERLVLGEGGIVIRYGRFFGPGTYFEAEPPLTGLGLNRRLTVRPKVSRRCHVAALYRVSKVQHLISQDKETQR
jgi:hypothetical protein